MPDLVPTKEWWTASEIAAAGLTDLSGTRKGVELTAKRDGWRETRWARQRTGKGGGWEYNWQLFPIFAKRQLLKDLAPAIVPIPEGKERHELWTWFDGLPETTKKAARERLAIVQKVDVYRETTRCTMIVAVAIVAKEHKVSDRTVFNWRDAIVGKPRHDWLVYLAPRHRAGPKKRNKVFVDPEFMARLKSDYLRPGKPGFSESYRRTEDYFIQHDMADAIPPEWLARRRYKSSTSPHVETLMREGEDALYARFPAQKRDRSELRALEWVNSDTHKWDVFVEWPLERGEKVPYIGRPQMVAFQDLSSNKVLSFYVGRETGSAAVAAAAKQMLTEFGIPDYVVLDNGRENASKLISGGARSRYRFKAREDEVPGLFLQVGTQVRFTKPYSGQSKQIERAFRDFAHDIAKHPAFDGAYTGHKVDAKPSDYGMRAVPLAVFLEVVTREIHSWNARDNRRSEVAYGRSFDAVFAEKYANSPIRKATPEQLRLFLMGAKTITTDSRSGVVRLRGNEYYAPWIGELAGQKLCIRFDPSDFWSPGVYAYDLDGAYLGHLPCKLKTGYANMAECLAHEKARREFIKTVKKASEAERKYSALQLGQDLLDIPHPDAPPLEAKVVRPLFSKAAELRALPEREETAQDREVANVVRASFEPKPDDPAEDDPWFAFKRVQEIEARLAAGEAVSSDQVRWAERFKATPKFKGQLAAFELMGEAAFASG